jgi:hypothetical protein
MLHCLSPRVSVHFRTSTFSVAVYDPRNGRSWTCDAEASVFGAYGCDSDGLREFWPPLSSQVEHGADA